MPWRQRTRRGITDSGEGNDMLEVRVMVEFRKQWIEIEAGVGGKGSISGRNRRLYSRHLLNYQSTPHTLSSM